MLTHKTSKYQDASFYWNDKKLNDIKPYSVIVTWPDGTRETLELLLEVRYEGYDDFPCQYAFLVITHNGFRGCLEIEYINKESLALITDLIVD